MPLRNARPSHRQDVRLASFGDFSSRLPTHAKSPLVWGRFLHLARQIYRSPFAAIVALKPGGPDVLDWADNRLDAAFSEYVDRLENQTSFSDSARPLQAHNSLIISRNWICVRISYFCTQPKIGIAIFVERADEKLLDTASLHSFEKVLSAFLRTRIPHEDPTAPSSWERDRQRRTIVPSPEIGAEIPKRG